MSDSSADDDPKQSHFLSCSEVARRLRLSRQRFWQLRKEGVFPEPTMDEASGRGFYSLEQVEVCMDLRRRNVGMNGRPVLFYSPRPISTAPQKTAKKKPIHKVANKNQPIIDALRSLGLATVTDAEVARAILEHFPNGIDGVDQGEVVRTAFLAVQRKN